MCVADPWEPLERGFKAGFEALKNPQRLCRAGLESTGLKAYLGFKPARARTGMRMDMHIHMQAKAKIAKITFGSMARDYP